MVADFLMRVMPDICGRAIEFAKKQGAHRDASTNGGISLAFQGCRPLTPDGSGPVKIEPSQMLPRWCILWGCDFFVEVTMALASVDPARIDDALAQFDREERAS